MTISENIEILEEVLGNLEGMSQIPTETFTAIEASLNEVTEILARCADQYGDDPDDVVGDEDSED